jgi:3-oxoacyl-[acyl-carrier-protein] synthase II
MLDAAVRSVREGYCDMALVCGADSILNWQALDELCKLGILNDKYISGAADSMPAYSSRARGALPSEGGAAIVIERKKDAIGRGANIYAEIKACGQYCVRGGADYESGGPSLDNNAAGFARLFEKLYAGAGFDRQDAVLANLNASAIGALDECELNGLRLLGQKHGSGYFDNIKLSGLKPYTGHCFSASFVLETAIAAAALKENLVYSLPYESDSPDLKELFDKDFNGAQYNKTMIFSGCLDANFAGVALERL